MANKFLAALFGGTKQEKDLKKLRPIVKSVNDNSEWAKSLSHEEIVALTNKWKSDLKEKRTTLDELLPKAFALAREASYRVINERHYDVQIMGAIVLHQGSILELKTGEGKTLTCVPAAYLNALTSEGVHIVTVNDYLAKRDRDWMGPIYEYLGLSVGVILSNQDNRTKQIEYSKDITYGTNNEFGFDYLRDNMKTSFSDKIQSKHSYCIVDEIDSILIDEARTPLIISGQADDDSESVRRANLIVPFLKECEKDPSTGDYYELSKFEMLDKEKAQSFDERGDYRIDEKSKNITFTKQGITNLERILKRQGLLTINKDESGEDITSIYDDGNFEYIHYVTEAVIAHKLFERDVDYVVKDGEVQIVDQFTGRILPGRRYNNGLHQAIEAKEGVKILAQSKIFATVTFQNFFKMYKKLSGMTGTADTEASEFTQIYGLDVVVVPTNKPVIREDLPDLLFYDEKQKFNAIVKEVQRVNQTGQPVLVGTVSIEKSEVLSALLRKAGIKHEVLNAKNHAREAYIIGEAGAKGAVTISTNMAGRGTDIKLGGSLEHLALKRCGSEASEEEFKRALDEVKPEWIKAYNEVKALGGLYIIGSERHESRRIDNQLRGRSGRQGDPGRSRFFVSLEDNLMRLFASDTIRNIIGSLGLKDGEPIENKMLSNAIEKAQLRVEERNFEIRKRLLEYDNVLNEQRNYIYEERDSILLEDDLSSRVLDNIKELCLDSYKRTSKEGYKSFRDSLLRDFTTSFELSEDEYNSGDVVDIIYCRCEKIIKEKEALISKEHFNYFLRSIYLKNIDKYWIDHLDNLDDIKDASHLKSYAQKNPLVEYKNEASDAYDRMLNEITLNICKMSIAVKFTIAPIKNSSVQNLVLGPRKQRSHITDQTQQNNTIIRNTPKVGRNEPCPCGSGKKYKHCCGQNS